MVYEGILQGERVAVKKPILSTSEDIDKFHRQLQLLCKLDHPGIAKLVAAHAQPPNYMFFYEFYDRGSLAEMLHVEEWMPSFDQVLLIMLQLAKALNYLHGLGIIHRDVKPANILLDKALHPHLADFGLAEYQKDLKKVSRENWKPSGKPTGGFHKKTMVGTLLYMAPEILRKHTHTEKTDVYSYGVTFNELLTGVVPYTDLRAKAQAHTVLEMNYTEQKLTAAVVSDGLRPALASSICGASSSILSLIQRCWHADPLARPSFDEIAVELDAILQHMAISASVAVSPRDMDASSARIIKESLNWMSKGEDLSKDSSVNSNSGPTICLDSSRDPFAYSPVVSCGSFTTCGRRETMEDRHFLAPHFFSDIHAFGIFDGHRGAEAAEFSAGALPVLLKNLGSISRNPFNALVEAFMKTDEVFRKELDFYRNSNKPTQKDWHPGCTAIAALIIRNKLFVANAGDCRTILCRGGQPYPLSRDHVASNNEERQRVLSAGGDVKWQVDTWRIGQAGLQVTRSIGDDDLKPAVTAEPEIMETILSVEDEYIVMASDGLWDVISNTDVVNIIRDTVKEPGMCSKRLATEAAERGSKDNITVIVVFLCPVSTAERIY